MLSRAQRIVVSIGAAVTVGMVLFPPWTQTTYRTLPYGGGPVMLQRSWGYGPIFSPPTGVGYSVNIPLLLVQVAIAVMIVGGLVWMLKER